MNQGGWIFMLGSWIVILGLFLYCMIRTLCSSKRFPSKKSKK